MNFNNIYEEAIQRPNLRVLLIIVNITIERRDRKFIYKRKPKQYRANTIHN